LAWKAQNGVVRAGVNDNRHLNHLLLIPPPNREMQTMRTARPDLRAGFTLVEIMIVVAIIGLLAAISIPNVLQARQTAQTSACINNLRLIEDAKNRWALENGCNTGDPVASTDLQPYLGHSSSSQFPTCPLGASYNIGNIGVNPTCPNASGAGTNTHNAVLN
jgi:prepilin-type N-terminal cleavage/methylation domain-containing protein